MKGGGVQGGRNRVLITGGGSGLGRGLSLHFASRGHAVLVIDADLPAAEETLAAMGPAAGSSRAYGVDIASEQQVDGFFQQAGRPAVDILINNAGLQYMARLEEFPQGKWDRLIDVMLKGVCLMTRSVLPGMRSRGFGRIINIGSIHSLVASPYKSAYVAAKHAVLGFSKVIALETADVNITINTICPSYIRTPLVEAQIKDQARIHGIPEAEVPQRIMLEPMPKKVFVTVEEVAAAIEYLASPLACNVTGQTITIDGGWTSK